MLAQLSGSLLHSPIISTETEGVGRAWTLSGSLLHSPSSPQRQRKPGRTWALPGLCHSLCPHLFIPAKGMLPPASHRGLQHGSRLLHLPASAG